MSRPMSATVVCCGEPDTRNLDQPGHCVSDWDEVHLERDVGVTDIGLDRLAAREHFVEQKGVVGP